MTERLLQFIWQFQYFNHQALTTIDGQYLQVLHAGEWNTHQGPDFKQARIRINDTLWAGEVELHIKASDWHKHQHTNDSHYSKVILHAVWEYDVPIIDQLGNPIPTIELQSRVSNLLLNRYQNWMEQQQPIPCHADIASVPSITWHSWKERLLVERLQQKAAHIEQMLHQTNNNWETVFWQLLCRYFGAGINSESFEQLAASIPVTILAKHKHQLQQIEALLLGQAGLLSKQFYHPYPLLLQREYAFLSNKYKLEPITKLPVFLRMRPVNFPTIRLAQLAMLIHQSIHLFSQLKEANDIKTLSSLFAVTANDFWNDHFNLEEHSEYQPKKLGKQMINTLLINTVIPILFAYGKYAGEPRYCERAIKWLDEIAPEKNTITNSFSHLQIANTSAFDSQALLQLKNNYCNSKRCLECAVGNAILKKV